jgi:cytochrome c-type biogenesis protein
MSQDISLFLVFTAGLLSFLSPCVLPLIPSYIGILGGVGFGEGNRPRLIRAALGFVLGFSAVFITLGILVSTTFFFMGDISKYINWAAGIVVIVLGLNVIFDFLSFLNYEKRPFLQKLMAPGISGVPAAFIAGAAFGTGWTPCIGPILTAILLLAGQGGKTGTAVFYLSVYSAGLAIPFILAALFFDSFLKNGERLRSHLPLIRRISGILLVVIGIMILAGRYSALNGLILKQVSGYIVWAETKAFPFRLLANALVWIQSF